MHIPLKEPSSISTDRSTIIGNNRSVLAIIPARSGSKSIPHKNIRLVAGKPLLAWSIEQARAAREVGRILVSTDSPDYAEIATAYGAECPFLRPKVIAGDRSTDIEVFEHALAWLREHEGYAPELCVHLRPTCPVRRPGTIDAMVRLLRERPDLDSVRTVTPVLHPPFKMWHRDEHGLLTAVAKVDGLAEPWNEPRQRLPATFLQTASIDVVWTKVIIEQHSMSGQRIYGQVEDRIFDIDEEHELRLAELILAVISKQTPRTYCFDIDGVIATIVPDNDYRHAQPRQEVIAVINHLHNDGNRIVLYTARGSTTNIDWRELTRQQLQAWQVSYDELRFDKPAADVYVDDRMIPLDQLDILMHNFL